MEDFEIRIPTNDVCSVCRTRLQENAAFCSGCGAFLKDDGVTPDTSNLPLVNLLSQVCSLQGELLKQFKVGQIQQSRQFRRALQLQSQQLEKTFAHAAAHIESSERRVQLWQRWITGLAVGVVVVSIAAFKLVG